MVFGSRGEEEEKMMEHKGLFGLGDGKVGGQKIIGSWKSERKEKIQFSFMCMWLERWKCGGMENSFIWLRRKMRR